MPFCYEQTKPLGVPVYAVGCPKAKLWLRLSVLILFFLSPIKRVNDEGDDRILFHCLKNILHQSGLLVY